MLCYLSYFLLCGWDLNQLKLALKVPVSVGVKQADDLWSIAELDSGIIIYGGARSVLLTLVFILFIFLTLVLSVLLTLKNRYCWNSYEWLSTLHYIEQTVGFCTLQLGLLCFSPLSLSRSLSLALFECASNKGKHGAGAFGFIWKQSQLFCQLGSTTYSKALKINPHRSQTIQKQENTRGEKIVCLKPLA